MNTIKKVLFGTVLMTLALAAPSAWATATSEMDKALEALAKISNPSDVYRWNGEDLEDITEDWEAQEWKSSDYNYTGPVIFTSSGDMTYPVREEVVFGGGLAAPNAKSLNLTHAADLASKEITVKGEFRGGVAASDEGFVLTADALKLNNVTYHGKVSNVVDEDAIEFAGINWDLTGGLEQYGCLSHFERYANTDANAKLLVMITDDQPVGDYVIATGDFTDVTGKDTFMITNVTSGATATITIGGVTLLHGTWWHLVIDEDELIFSNPSLATLSDVFGIDEETGATNATAVVTAGGFQVEPEADGDYLIPFGLSVKLDYTAADDCMFACGAKTKSVNLGPLMEDTSMDLDCPELKPVAEALWADVREIAIDTRERIVVGSPNEVLPIAYSTNKWGAVEGADQLTLTVPNDGAVLAVTNVSGYAEWHPKMGAYGVYTVVCDWWKGIVPFADATRDIFYSQPFPLTVSQPEEGGTIKATASTLDDEEDTVLACDFVKLVATPTDRTWALESWSVMTNDIAAQELLEQDPTSLTNRFEMPLCDTTVEASFVIAESYREELLQGATNSYLSTSNNLENLRLNRLADDETDKALAAAKGALDVAAGAIFSATKPYTADAATNTLATALTGIEEEAQETSDDKPYDLLIAADFEAIADEGSYDPETGTFTVDGRAFQTNVNAFTSFTEAYAEKTYVPFVTNVFVFGMQTIAKEPTQLFGWNLVLVPSKDAEGADVSAILSVEKDFATDELISITNVLAEIAGEGTIVLAKTEDQVSPTVYDDYIAGEAVILVVNTGVEQEKDSGEIEVCVDRSVKTGEGETLVVLPGVENPDGGFRLTVEENATNDVLVAGTIKTVGDIFIRNDSTNELELAGVVRGNNVQIRNFGEMGEIEGSIVASEILAKGDVRIDNAAHLEANVVAAGDITINNGSVNTVVGTYDGKSIRIEGGKEGAISNVTFVSDGPVMMNGVNILTGPFAIDAPENAITNFGTVVWNVRGANTTAKLADFDTIEFVKTEFGIQVDPKQEIGRYVLAGNAGSLAGSKCVFQLSNGDTELSDLTLGAGAVEDAANGRAYRLDINEANALMLTVFDLSTRFEERAYEICEGGAVRVYVRGGSPDHAVQATVTYTKGTGSYKAAFLNGKEVEFPLVLSWAKGEVASKELLFRTEENADSSYDRTFALQLSASVGENVFAGYDLCTVTLKDAGGKGKQYKYVRALAYPANAGTVSGSGKLTSKTTERKLVVEDAGIGTFKGWYPAKADDPTVPDLTKRLTKKAKYTADEPGTYFAYFADVEPVSTVIAPDTSLGEGVGYDPDAEIYLGTVGVKLNLPCECTEGGTLKVTCRPDGISWKDGCLTGIPTAAGTYKVKFTASNDAGSHVIRYVFKISQLPKQAVGTWTGVVRDSFGPGIGSVKFTAGSTGKLSAKVVTQFAGEQTFKGTGYDRIDDMRYEVNLVSEGGETLWAQLDLSAGWGEPQFTGFYDVSESKYWSEYMESGFFEIVRNPYDEDDGDPEARQLLAAYVATYEDALYRNGAEKGEAYFKVKSNGNVLVKSNVGSKEFSGTVSGGLKVWEDGTGTVETALRNGNYIWSADALLDSEKRTVTGDARYLKKNGDDQALTIGVGEPE